MTGPISINIFGDFRAVKPEILSFDASLQNILNGGNINICDFEAPIRTKGSNPIIKSGPCISQPKESAVFLLDKGFNVILLANNHLLDFGEESALETINAFSGVTVVGAGMPEDAFAVRILEMGGVNLGFLSFVQHEFGTVDSPSQKERVGAAWINSLEIEDIIKNAKTKVDFLIVCPHAGVEHTEAPLPEWRTLFRYFIDWGADIVVASHPHSPQGWETYKGKQIYYSLGNFYFDGLVKGESIPYWNNGLGVHITIDDEGLHSSDFAITFKNGHISIDEGEETKQHLDYVNSLLADDNAYLEYIDEMCSSHYYGYRYAFLRGVCGTSFKVGVKHFFKLLGGMILGKQDETYLLNTLRCESHRWMVERYIRNHGGLL